MTVKELLTSYAGFPKGTVYYNLNECPMGLVVADPHAANSEVERWGRIDGTLAIETK